MGAEQLDRILAVLGGIANVLLFGRANLRKAFLHSGHDFGRVVHTQGGLGDDGEPLGLAGLDGGHIVHTFNQMDALGQLAHGAFDLGVAFVANHDELIALAVQFGHLDMHLGDQGAGGIKHPEPTPFGLVLHRFGHPVRAEHQGGTWGDVVQVFDEDGAPRAQVVDHMGVVHDFVAHINGRAKLAQGVLNDVNGPVHTGTKTPGFGQNNFRGCGCVHNTPINCTSNWTAWPARGWLKSNSTAASPNWHTAPA